MSGTVRQAKSAFEVVSSSETKAKRGKRSSVPPVTLRLTAEERARLEELATGMTLSAYIRACVFSKEERRRKRRPKDAVADKKAMAEALALLGQSRIANNLNQLAKAVNIGSLPVVEETERDIRRACADVAAMREELLRALGQRSDLGSS